MKGSAISVRIADFLKEYPPFVFLKTHQLRELASNGKVKFHEDGEIIFSEGQPRDKWLYVIQKGSVRVIEERAGTEKLIDLRGPGDLLGLQGIRSEEPYLHTCKTETETILYGLPRALFVEMAEKSPQCRRYLAAYFSLNPAYLWNIGGGDSSEPELPDKEPTTLRKGGLYEVDPPQQVSRSHLVAVMGDTPVREVARKLRSKRIDCVVVVDDNRWPIGKLTDADLRERILEGSIQPSAPVRELMFTDLIPVRPDATTGDLLIQLTRFEKHFLVTTEDGTLTSPVIGLVSERNLFLQYGRFPTVIGEAISSAPDTLALRTLRDRQEALILEFLDNRGALKWLMEMTGVLNRKLIQRLVELTVEKMAASGWGEPPAPFSWLMMGSGGRDELLIRSAVYHALVYGDPAPDAEAEVRRYFLELARQASEAIRQCGFLENPQNVLAQNPDWCLPLDRMKERFTRLITDPLEQHVYSARDAFDFQALSETGCPLAEALSEHIDDTLASQDDFIRQMASDSLMNQPPRTIFQGYVVDQQGIRRKELAIKLHALLPLVDVARVFSLESGCRRPTSTLKRLESAAARIGTRSELGQLLGEASEGLLVAQFARISQGLKSGTDGAVIHPSELDPETRTLLITTFRTILRLLEATASHFELNLRA